jgi:hypothetical protein
MVNWKSKYLKYKLKYINAKQKAGMNVTENPQRMENFNKLPFHIQQKISYDATIKYANEQKKKVLDKITEDYADLFPVEVEGATLENLMISQGIEWIKIKNIENASIEDIDENLWYNYNNIRDNLDLLSADY